MTAERVVEVLGWLDQAGIAVWVDGGWGVDALLGRQTRAHGDLDVAIGGRDAARFTELMADRGFRTVRDDGPFNFVVADADGGEVDVHLVDLARTRRDRRGVEVYGPDGLEYEVGALEATGTILGRRVACVTADFQVRSHTGYAIDDDDVRDVLALHDRFGVPLPEPYRDDRDELVRAGYDRLGGGYADWSGKVEGDARHRLVADFADRLPDGARVLDLGCGPGVPSTRALAQRFAVVGVDASPVQLALARRHVPAATFIHGDFTALDLPAGSFDGAVALYSITHVPRERHARLLRRIAGWLRPGGLLLATLGADDSAGWRGPWLGVEMYFSHFDADANRRLLRGAGFALLHDEVVTVREPEGAASFLWVLACRQATAPG